jgi:hypothetical protein
MAQSKFKGVKSLDSLVSTIVNKMMGSLSMDPLKNEIKIDHQSRAVVVDIPVLEIIIKI